MVFASTIVPSRTLSSASANGSSTVVMSSPSAAMPVVPVGLSTGSYGAA